MTASVSLGRTLNEPPFVAVDWRAPLDVEKRLAAVPKHLTAKGLAFRSVLDAAKAGSGVAMPDGPYHLFHDYPIAELLALIPRGAALAFPGKPPREAVAGLGRIVYRAARESTLGKVVFGVAARDFGAAVNVCSRVYSAISQGRVSVEASSRNEAIVRLESIWIYPYAYHVGTFLEAMSDYGVAGEVLVSEQALDRTRLKLVWR
jgi:uncharacterized protein (TIGR02265 family)